jgi:3-mercaptopyruvate sulfurtransferase SseA
VVEKSGSVVSAVADAASARTAEITSETVVLDVREPFAFATSHIQGSHWVDPNIFRNEKSRFKGALPEDALDVTRKLARMGIGPNTPVVVVGKGWGGHAEEGRLAWLLNHYGVKHVTVAVPAYFKAKMTTDTSPDRKAVPWWDPEVKSAQVVGAKELREIVARPHKLKQIRVLDVRLERDYLGQEGFGLKRPVPELGALNVPWKEFIDQWGRPNASIVAKLADVGITKNDNLVLISGFGFESALALMVLQELGFTSVAHVPAGLDEILTK